MLLWNDLDQFLYLSDTRVIGFPAQITAADQCVEAFEPEQRYRVLIKGKIIHDKFHTI